MPTRKGSKKAAQKKRAKNASKSSARGRAAVEKGRNFEEAVADLYRLLGAEVIQNIEIHQKKVDILATFRIPGSPRVHRVLVECKDEKRAVDANQRVQAVTGLLKVARISGEADSAEIITRVPWSDQAKGFAKTAGIDVFTYAEKIEQLIDFTRYLKDLKERYEKGDPARPGAPPLGSYYVDLSVVHAGWREAEKIDSIDAYIRRWIQDDKPRRQLAIFGEFGSGKSSLCQKLAHDLAKDYLESHGSTRIPLLLNLREFVGKIKIDAYITSFLDQECHVANPKFHLFKAMNDAGVFLLIFDGFDEMAVKVDADTLESNLMEVDKLAASPLSKVLLTSRPEYFVSIEEERLAISPRQSILSNREAEYEPMTILPWDEKQVESFLEKRVPLVKEGTQPWTYYRDRIRGIPSLSDLSQRPVLLEMIVKTLPVLVQGSIPINLPNLYKTYLQGEIKRQRVSKKREFLLNEQVRLSILRRLAADLYCGTVSNITFATAVEYVEESANPPKIESEAYTREFLTNSFLVRRGDVYHFSHKSIMEYLVATQLNNEVITDTPQYFTRTRIRPAITVFLRELEPDEDTLLSWIESTKNSPNSNSTFLGGNAATILTAMSADSLSADSLAGRDLAGTVLSHANFHTANLVGANLANANLSNANLVAAKFTQADLQGADLSGAVIRVCVVGPVRSDEKSPGYTSPVMDLVREFRLSGGTKRDPLVTYVYEDPRRLGRKQGKHPVAAYFKLESAADLESIRKRFSEKGALKVAIYADEIDELARQYIMFRSNSPKIMNQIEALVALADE